MLQSFGWVFWLALIVLYDGVFDRSQVLWSPYLKKEIRLAPLGYMVKMKNWSGWRDDYLHLFQQLPTSEGAIVSSYKKIDGLSRFRVSVVRRQTMSDLKQICIFENVNVTQEKFSINCKDFYRIQNVSEAYFSAEKKMEKDGQVYISFYYPYRYNKLEKVDMHNIYFKVNNLRVRRLTSNEELKNSFALPKDDYNPYEDLGDLKPIITSKETVNDFLFANQYLFSPSLSTNDESLSFRKDVIRYALDLDADQWLKENFKNSLISQWVLGLIALHYQVSVKEFIKNKHERTARNSSLYVHTAYQAIRIHGQLVECFGKFFQSSDLYQTHLERIEKIVFNTEEEKKSIVEMRRLARVSNVPAVGNVDCEKLEPPQFLMSIK